MHPFHQLKTTSLQGQPIDFKEFEGKVVLIVNTASECGLTYQYQSLQALHEKYASQGLIIIGFPCNQFGQQEPGDAEQIAQGCFHESCRGCSPAEAAGHPAEVGSGRHAAAIPR